MIVQCDGSTPSLPTALYVDLDTFRSATPAIEIDAVESAVAEIGRICVRSCVSTDIENGATSLQLLTARSYQTQVFQSRDTMRMMLASAITEQILRTGIRQYVFITEDEQFAYLPTLATSLCAEVKIHCFGTRPPEHSKAAFISAFDHFRYYGDIAKPPPVQQISQLREKYAKLLVQTVWELASQGRKAVGAAWVPMMKERNPEWSPQMLGFHKPWELADFACNEGLAERNTSGEDYELVLTVEGRKIAKHIADKEAQVATQEDRLVRIRSAIEGIFGGTVPEAKFRHLVFQASQWILSEQSGAEDGINLVRLSYDVVDYLSVGGIRQDSVYRLLNGVYRVGAFDFKPNALNKHDPLLIRARIDSRQFDDAFVLNILHMHRKYPVLVESAEEDMAMVLYGTPSKANKVSVMLRLAVDPDFGRANLRESLAKIPTS